MKDAKSLLLEVLAAIPGGEKVALLFAEDGVVDLPFLHSVGVEPRYKGRAAIAGFYDVVKQLYPDLVFKPEDIHVLIETPDQVFAEYIAHPAAAATGRRIHHMFAARLVAEGGEIKLLREPQRRRGGTGAPSRRCCRPAEAVRRDLFVQAGLSKLTRLRCSKTRAKPPCSIRGIERHPIRRLALRPVWWPSLAGGFENVT
jgi:hypothetical protein